jgi:Uma2 family endonuclease
MVATIARTFSPIAITSEPIWRLSVSQYHLMIESGILTKDTKLELLEGLLVAKMPKNPSHSLSTGLLQDALLSILPSNYHLRLQEPITLEESEPEPDLAIVQGQRKDYRDRHPTGKDLELVIEVSGTSLNRDRTLKHRIYANAEIPIYWILNLEARQLEVYSNPLESEYTQCQVFQETESISITLRGTEEAIAFVAVDSLL